MIADRDLLDSPEVEAAVALDDRRCCLRDRSRRSDVQYFGRVSWASLFYPLYTNKTDLQPIDLPIASQIRTAIEEKSILPGVLLPPEQTLPVIPRKNYGTSEVPTASGRALSG